MKAVIVAGGKGTRLASVLKSIPKPMVEIGPYPLLEHQIRLLKRYGADEIILVINHLAECIEEYFGDGRKWGLEISYFREQEALGSAGALKAVGPSFQTPFIVFYGDVMIEMNVNRLFQHHKKTEALCTIVVHPSSHIFDSDLVEVDESSRIIQLNHRPHPAGTYLKNLGNAGAYILSPEATSYVPSGRPSDFFKDVLPNMIQSGRVFAYKTFEYLKDAGTPERLEEVRVDFESGRVARKNRDVPQRAIFLDRDGVINDALSPVDRSEDFYLIPGVSEAIRQINESNFLTIVVTNQPGIAKNSCSLSDLDTIHNKMETLLGENGAWVDGIYFCPHHPDGGYPGENSQLKINCGCRKPKTGMIEEASQEFNIDLSTSAIVGDSFRDILCGRGAGLLTVGVRTGRKCVDGDLSVQPDHMFNDLPDAVNFLLPLERRKRQ